MPFLSRRFNSFHAEKLRHSSAIPASLTRFSTRMMEAILIKRITSNGFYLEKMETYFHFFEEKGPKGARGISFLNHKEDKKSLATAHSRNDLKFLQRRKGRYIRCVLHVF